MIFRQTQLVLFAFTNTEKQGVFFDPLFWQDTKGTIVELHKLLPVRKRLFYVCYGYLLVAKHNIDACIEPVGITADMYFGLRFRCVETKILKCFKSINRHLHVLHRIDEKKKPVVLKHICALQGKLFGTIWPYKVGM
jgi:hypothetical protein